MKNMALKEELQIEKSKPKVEEKKEDPNKITIDRKDLVLFDQ